MNAEKYQNDTYEKISKFLKDIKVDLIKKISCKYNLDEKLVIRDFINNEWQDENKDEEIIPVIVQKDKTRILNNNVLCKAKKYGDCRCTLRRQRESKYCGTHLKQIEKSGNLKQKGN